MISSTLAVPVRHHDDWSVVSTKVVCDGPGDQRAEDMKAATA
jgi:hypothetical protein